MLLSFESKERSDSEDQSYVRLRETECKKTGMLWTMQSARVMYEHDRILPYGSFTDHNAYRQTSPAVWAASVPGPRIWMTSPLSVVPKARQ